MRKQIIIGILFSIFTMIILYADVNNVPKFKNNNILLNKAISYMNGKNVEKDYKKAEIILIPLCKKKILGSCFLLGTLYSKGKYGLEKDIEKSIQYQGLACNYGSSFACIEVAKKLFTKDEDLKAINYIKKSCDYNSSKGCQFLGLYYEGNGIHKNYNKSMFFHNKACNLDDSLSCYSQAVFYLRGLGVEKNYKKAIEFFEKSSMLGYSLALETLELLKQKE